MALSDRDIIITPNRGASSEPNILFRGADAASSASVYLRVYNSGTIGTLSFEGNSGQLLSITDSMSGSIFSVNDVSGIPSIEVFDTGEVRLAQYNGYVDILNPVQATSTNSGALQVSGGVGIGGNLYVGGTIYGIASVTGVITTATNIAGGTASQIVYQTAPGVTGFVTAPSAAGTALVWNGSAYVWQTASGGNANGVLTVSSATAATRYLTFVDNNFGTASTSSFYTDAGISYNPSTNALTLGGTSPASLTINAGAAGGTVNVSTDVTSGIVNLFTGVGSGGQLIMASGGLSTVIIGGPSSTVRLGSNSGNTTVRIGAGSDGSLDYDSNAGGGTPFSFMPSMTTGLLSVGGSSTGRMNVKFTSQASSTVTGALTVVGGVGIGGNLYVGGTIYGTGGTAITATVNFEAIATAGQTTFTIPGGYTVGYIEVFANGILLGSSNYTASNGTTVVLNNARNAGDIIRIVAAAAGGTATAFNGGTITNNLVINVPTQATSTTTGALQIINGGAGIGGNIYAGGTIYQNGVSVTAIAAAMSIALGA